MLTYQHTRHPLSNIGAELTVDGVRYDYWNHPPVSLTLP
jgi:hypothetical protein